MRDLFGEILAVTSAAGAGITTFWFLRHLCEFRPWLACLLAAVAAFATLAKVTYFLSSKEGG